MGKVEISYVFTRQCVCIVVWYLCVWLFILANHKQVEDCMRSETGQQRLIGRARARATTAGPCNCKIFACACARPAHARARSSGWGEPDWAVQTIISQYRSA